MLGCSPITTSGPCSRLPAAMNTSSQPSRSKSATTVLTLLRSIVDRNAQTILMVTHDPTAASYADVVLFMRDGAIVGALREASSQQIAQELARMEEQA